MDIAPTCAQCGTAVTGKRFCSSCGAPLADQALNDAAAPPATAHDWSDGDASVLHGSAIGTAATALLPSTVGLAEEPARWSHEGPAAPSSQSRPNLLAAVVVAALALSGWAIMRGVEEHTLSGSVLLLDTAHMGLAAGRPCTGQGGYGDLGGGAQVVLTDDRGETLSTGRLSAGEYDGLGCVFSFALEDVTRADFYGLSIAGGNRGHLQYSYQELSAANWSLQLSIGDD